MTDIIHKEKTVDIRVHRDIPKGMRKSWNVWASQLQVWASQIHFETNCKQIQKVVNCQQKLFARHSKSFFNWDELTGDTSKFLHTD